MSNGKQAYTKPWMSLEDQAAQLARRGLPDAVDHLDDLANIGYYRLSGYWYPFRQIDSATGTRRDDFIVGVDFGDVLAIYQFDVLLREVLFRAISTIEIAVRVQVGYELGRIGPFAHLDRALLDPSVREADFNRFQTALSELQAKAHEDFVSHFDDKYGGKMPVWVATEILQFGQLVRLYEFAPYETRRAIASNVGARADEYRSWLKALNIVRNVSAHHSRLWNRSIGIKPQMRYRRKDPDLGHAVESVDRVYGVVAIVAYLLRQLGYSELLADLTRVLQDFPVVPGVSPAMMKMPVAWAQEPLWA